MSPELEKALQDFKDTWIGKKVEIIGQNHPHKGRVGEAIDVEDTNVGWGLKVKLDDGAECFIFNGADCRMCR